MNPLLNNNVRINRPNFFQLYSQVMQDPQGFLAQLGIPKHITTPKGAVEYMLQSGRVSQNQVNQAQVEAGQIDINQPIAKYTDSSVHRTDV